MRVCHPSVQVLGAAIAMGLPAQVVAGDRLERERLIGDPSLKHADDLSHLQALPGNRLLAAGEDGSARLWDLDGGVEIARFGHDGNYAWHAVPLPDGRIASAGGDVRLWDLDDPASDPVKWEDDQSAYRLAVIPDTTFLASAHADGVVLIRDWVDGSLVRKLEVQGTDDVYSVASIPGHRLAAAIDDIVYVWDYRSGELLTERQLVADKDVYTLSPSPDGDSLLASVGSELHCLGSADLAEAWTVAFGATTYIAAWAPDGESVALCSAEELICLKADDGTERWRTGTELGTHRAVAYSADGSEVFSSGRGAIFRYRAADGVQTYPAEDRRIAQGYTGGAALSADGRLAFLAAADGWIYPYAADSGEALAGGPWKLGHRADSLRLSPDGTALVAAHPDSGSISRLAIDGGRLLLNFGAGEFEQLAIGAADRYFVVESGGIHEWVADKRIGELPLEPGQTAERVSASADGRRIAAVADQAAPVSLWTLTGGKVGAPLALGHDLGEPDFAALSADGRAMALVKDEHCQFWFEPESADLDGEQLAALEVAISKLGSESFAERTKARRDLIGMGAGILPHIEDRHGESLEARMGLQIVARHLARSIGGKFVPGPTLEGDLSAFAFSPDATRWAAIVGYNHSPRVVFGRCDPATGESAVLQSFTDPASPRDLEFSPDGSRVLTANRNATATLYRVTDAPE